MLKFNCFIAQSRRRRAGGHNYMVIKDLEVRLVVPAEVDVLGLLEVQESDLILKVTDFVADCNPVGRTENAVLEGFVKDGDFFEHF